ncbi:MAG: hypothetical protein V4564_07840 [Pseudomonadota bacterium]
MALSNNLFVEENHVVVALSNTTPSSSSPTRVSLKNYERCVILIQALNATTVTGSAITLKQATDIANANTDEKAVAFTTAYRVLDVAAGDTLSSFAVAANTFTTDATNSKSLLYVIEVDPTMLDVNNGFDCLRVGTGNATASTLTVTMVLTGAKYGKSFPATAITN